MRALNTSKEKFRNGFERYAESNGFTLNPDKKVVDTLLDGMLWNKEEYGYQYCPCRAVTGDKGKDSKLVCPCVYIQEEVERMGRCWCGLFVTADSKFKTTFTEQEMQEWYQIWDKVEKRIKS